MNVIHIETGRHLYGGALQVAYLLKGLKKYPGHHGLVCPAGSKIAELARSDAAVFELPMRGELDPQFPVRLWRILAEQRPDLIHVHSRRGADIWGAVMARLLKIPAVITRRVDNPEIGWLARVKYRQFSGIITISQGIRQVLIKAGIPSEKIACVPSAVDYARYAKPCNKNWFLETFHLTHDSRAIGIIAQFIGRKGHRYLIDAIPNILETVPQARFLFLGKGPLEDDIRRLCVEHRLQDHVIFAGFRGDLDAVLPCLDLVVHPATMEGLGVALLQASAAGVPIVATRVGGIPEIVHHTKNGLLVNPGDADALAEAVSTILTDPNLSRRMGQQGQKIVKRHFSLDTMVAGNQRIYDQILPPKQFWKR